MPEPVRRLRYADHDAFPEQQQTLDQLLPDDHPVRDVWRFVTHLDVTPLLEVIQALPGQPGAPAFDPRILLTLWLYATLKGVGSSYQLEELCRHHLVYQWVCGGQTVSQRTLSGFRTAQRAYLNQLLTHSAATLMHLGVATLDEVAQDGLRVRASAGASSFHRAPTLAECLAQAQQQVDTLQTQLDEDPAAASRRAQAAQQQHAQRRVQRVQAAVSVMEQLQTHHASLAPSHQKRAGEPRSSTTDADARRMKMPAGGFRPAYNVQFATTVTGGVIVGVAVTNDGTDANQLPPMVAQIEERFDQKPKAMLVDGGFASLESIDQVQQQQVTVYAPVKDEQKQLKAGKDPYARKEKDTDQTAEWRERMSTPAAKACYRRRGQTAEWVNAQVRNRGWYRVTVRGVAKVLTLALWQAVAHNYGCLARFWAAQRRESARRVEE
jgi:transposase